MAQLEGKIQQTLEGKVSIVGTWHMIGQEAVKSPFEYHSVTNAAPVRAANPGESAGTELPGTGLYAGKFAIKGTGGALEEYKEDDISLKFSVGPSNNKIKVNGQGKNTFGTFSIDGDFEVTSMSFKALKNYVVAEAAAAVPASPRAGGSGRVRKKKRPYSPPHDPVKPVSTVKKQKVEPQPKAEPVPEAKETKPEPEAYRIIEV